MIDSERKAHWAGKRVLVTGASGFIGEHLCNALEERNAIVFRASRSSGYDITDADLVDWIADEFYPDSIFHLASRVTGARDPADVIDSFRNNVLTTVNVLTAAHRFGVRRVVCMGSLQEPQHIHMESAYSPYAAAEAAATVCARMFASLYGVPVTVARTFMVYGPGQKDTSKVLPYVITRLLKGMKADLSEGRDCFDWIHVRDVVDGLLAIHAAEDLNGSVVDLGTGELTPVSDVVSSAATMLKCRQQLNFGALGDREGEGEPRCAADSTETSRLTGWRSKINLARGIEETVAWYRQQNLITAIVCACSNVSMRIAETIADTPAVALIAA